MCEQLENWALRRHDNNVLGKMLEELRRDEQSRSPTAAAVCLIQVGPTALLCLSVSHRQSGNQSVSVSQSLS